MNEALLAATVGVPLTLAAALVLPPLRRTVLALAPWAAAPALAAALVAEGSLQASPLLLDLRLGLDATSRVFLLFTALLWLAAGTAALRYHANDARRLRLWVAWLLTLAGNLWLTVALDAAGFYAGFALMTFAGYALVVHTGSDEAMRAGRIYLAMSLLGEAMLLAGLLLHVGPIGNTTLPLPAFGGPHESLAAGLLFAGFGVKAGVVGLHMWLPLAHPVAPTPASAVLSGAMIKAGVLGWMRFLPIGFEPWPLLGGTAVALGLLAVFGAAAVGLTQRAPKTLLAYSSVSQMGFLTVAIGAALLAPQAWGPLAVAIALYALHHGLAKGALFLGAGCVPALAGRARYAALTVLALPALALAGAPLTSGMLAKHDLKAALEGLPSPWPDLLAVLMPLAAVGTTLLLARFWLAVAAADSDSGKRTLAPSWLAATVLSLAVAWTLPVAGPSEQFATGAWLTAAAPVLAGLVLTAVVARARPLRAQAPPRWPAGDLLLWLEPAIRGLWAVVLATSRWSDRPRPPQHLGRASRLGPAVARGEAQLRRFAVAGLALLVTLLVAAALLV
jgi:hydrogenase-4 component B